MTTAKTVGAVSSEAAEWYAINWQTIHQNVRRVQVRIVQATKAGRWNKVKSLQRLLTHSYSGKVLAVRRVTENTGKKTPGVDQIIWKTPEDKTQAVHALKRRGYQSQPLRRAYIPKSDGRRRPLGIPSMIDQLNPKIRGWVNYHRHVVSKRTFSHVDHSIFHSLRRWARRRHPKKSSAWLREKYYERNRRHNRCFFGERYDDEGQLRKVWLYRAKSTPIKRHIKVQGEANPYDPAYETYFAAREGSHMLDTFRGTKTLRFLW